MNTTPTILSGMRAVLQYAIDYNTDGAGWPSILESGDERDISRSWQFFLIEKIEAALSILQCVGDGNV
ncbi:hypothetical protein [Bradyrhizobium brasilense]|uniref:hypothetical protein n=1 Tax=Bradyrhizobium brasilense TaxID=1419277 RepID=UPI001E3B91E0|nr:hypothetical protein [Bradyrhizobium brasilense]MCC8972379.1 hypothetical protein [Bradyrhizobium brasilense]